MMRFVRLHTVDEGQTRFEDGVIPMTLSTVFPLDAPVSVSDAVGGGGVRFLQIPSGWSTEQAPVPHRMYLVVLAGVLDIEASDGEQRRFGPGSVTLLEDTSGIGHRARVVGMSPVQALLVDLNETG